jgi:hypothetical protein
VPALLLDLVALLLKENVMATVVVAVANISAIQQAVFGVSLVCLAIPVGDGIAGFLAWRRRRHDRVIVRKRLAELVSNVPADWRTLRRKAA